MLRALSGPRANHKLHSLVASFGLAKIEALEFQVVGRLILRRHSISVKKGRKCEFSLGAFAKFALSLRLQREEHERLLKSTSRSDHGVVSFLE